MKDTRKDRSDRTRGRRRKQLLDDLKNYWKFKEEAPDNTLWHTCFGTTYGPVTTQCNKINNNAMRWARRSCGGEAGFIGYGGEI